LSLAAELKALGSKSEIAMWMLDAKSKSPVHSLQLYLTVSEAEKLRAALDTLLEDPEANEHEHVLGGGCDVSLSIITDTKRKDLPGYTDAERSLLAGK
jgi:hypothetical protein